MPRQFGRFLLPATSFPVSDLPFTWPEEGLFTAWHDNGQKEIEQTWKDGKREGLQTIWHDNGQKASERTYKDGEPVSETRWDKEGNEIKK